MKAEKLLQDKLQHLLLKVEFASTFENDCGNLFLVLHHVVP
jgi:hypothetical protein